jgi:hypothetical protein
MRPIFAPNRNSVLTTALAAACFCASTGSAPPAAAGDAMTEKDALGILYVLQLAPKKCNWIGDTSKLDAKVTAAEQALNMSDADKTKLKADAEAEANKPENCAADGLLKAMFDDAVKGNI